MIEVEAVHLGADHLPVDLALDRPSGRIDGGQTALIRRKLALLRGHRLRRVVRHAVDELRLLRCAPVGEERRQIFITAGCGPGTRCTRRTRRTQ